MVALVIEALFALAFVWALVTYARSRDPLHRDLTLVFSAVTALFVLALYAAGSVSRQRPGTAAGILLLGQPYLTLRLVRRVRPIPAVCGGRRSPAGWLRRSADRGRQRRAVRSRAARGTRRVCGHRAGRRRVPGPRSPVAGRFLADPPDHRLSRHGPLRAGDPDRRFRLRGEARRSSRTPARRSRWSPRWGTSWRSCRRTGCAGCGRREPLTPCSAGWWTRRRTRRRLHLAAVRRNCAAAFGCGRGGGAHQQGPAGDGGGVRGGARPVRHRRHRGRLRGAARRTRRRRGARQSWRGTGPTIAMETGGSPTPGSSPSCSCNCRTRSGPRCCC